MGRKTICPYCKEKVEMTQQEIDTQKRDVDGKLWKEHMCKVKKAVRFKFDVRRESRCRMKKILK